MKPLTPIALAGLLAAALPLAAAPANVDSLQKNFASVRIVELPGAVAATVSAAAPAERQAVAREATRAALAVSPSSAPMIVGAVARSVPAAAGEAAATAASLQPKERGKFVRAAIGAAPGEVASIVTALVKAKPSSVYIVGMNAVDAAPKSSASIASAIEASTPAFKTLLARANPTSTPVTTPATLVNLLKRLNGMVATLSKSGHADTILAQELSPQLAATLPTAMGALAAAGAPTVGPPYTDGNPTAPEISAEKDTYEAPVRPPVYSSP
jgi:hypothetical protein